MIALIVLLAGFSALGVAFACAGICEWGDKRRLRQAAKLERLRVQHEQFVAERRMQQVVGDGLTRMLREARSRQ